jgi:hypothetical protein
MGDASGLNEKSRVVDESNGDLVHGARLVEPMQALVLDPSRPPAARLTRHPEAAAVRNRKALRQGRIEEAVTIEVIGPRHPWHVILQRLVSTAAG